MHINMHLTLIQGIFRMDTLFKQKGDKE
jgi:hypothetical protein